MHIRFLSVIARVGLCVLLAGAAGLAAAQSGAIADYRFENSFNDSLGVAPPLAPLVGGGGFFTSDVVFGRPSTVYRFHEGTGLQVALGNLVDGREYTVAFIARFDEPDRPWIKLMDTKALIEEDGLAWYFSEPGWLTWYPSDANSPGDAILPGHWYQIAVTRSAAGLLRVYVNGEEVIEHHDSLPEYAVFTSERLLTLFRDDDATGNYENVSGAVARVRLFNRALLPGEVAALEYNRPDLIFRDGFDPGDE